MPSTWSQQQVTALAERIDRQFLGYIFDAIMDSARRSAMDKGKGDRNQTFKRGLLATILVDVFECPDVLVSRALRKNRTSIADRVSAVRRLMASNNFGFGASDLLDLVSKMEEYRNAVIAGSEEPIDKSLKGWNASKAGFAFYLAGRMMALRYPAAAAEYVETRDLDEIEAFESEVKSRVKAGDDRRARAKVSQETARTMALETQQIIRKIDIKSPPSNGFDGIVDSSHPAVAVILNNRHKLSELAQLVCTEKAPPLDTKLKDLPHAICYMEPNPNPLKGEGKTAIRIWTKADKDSLAKEVTSIMDWLAKAKFSPTLKMPASESSRGKSSSYALLTLRAPS